MLMGWVDTQLVDPLLHFNYWGFSWVEPLPRVGMYVVFGLMTLSSLGILLGLFYRIFSILFFLCFTYVELIDITYYLNHYYFVSLVSFMMIWVPANRSLSLDVRLNLVEELSHVSRWCIGIFKVQISLVYIYAGLAKINYDWLFRAMPLAIWLPAKSSIPVIGWMFKFPITAYLFSWAGMLFDTFIVVFLLIRKTRWLAYAAVVVFHVMTGILFQIGIFPLVMIFAVTIFFSDNFHKKLLAKFSYLFSVGSQNSDVERFIPSKGTNFIFPFLLLFFAFQILFPWRYLLYPGNIFWTEEGYRFAWRVMLMEKAGTATFYVKDGVSGREGSVRNGDFLNDHQEKQMAMQPDLILQYAKFLRKHYEEEGVREPQVRAEVYVTLNASRSQLLIDPQIDLTQKSDTWKPKDWILPFKNNAAN